MKTRQDTAESGLGFEGGSQFLHPPEKKQGGGREGSGGAWSAPDRQPGSGREEPEMKPPQTGRCVTTGTALNQTQG